MNNQSMFVEGANPSMLWMQIADHLQMLSKSMMNTYKKRQTQGKDITWSELDYMNKELHNQLDVIIAGNINIKESRNMKQTIKLTESKLRGMIHEAVRRALTESIEGESNLDPEIVQAINNVAKGKVDKNHYDYYQDLRFLKTQGYRVAGDEVYRVSDKTVVAKFLAIYGRKNRNLECPMKDVVVKFLE